MKGTHLGLSVVGAPVGVLVSFHFNCSKHHGGLFPKRLPAVEKAQKCLSTIAGELSFPSGGAVRSTSCSSVRPPAV